MRPFSAAICGFLLLISLGLPAVFTMALAASDDEDAELRERVIVMTSGRVLTGFASRNAGGWIVEQTNGRVQVPIEQVRVVASSLRDAYHKQRDSVVEPTPATHMALAQWCISYRLHFEARDELRKCLKLDPDDSTARKLLKRLDDMLDPAAPATLPKDSVGSRTSQGFLAPDVESLGGLSPEAGATFTLRIQPLLMNKCGNASCHGSKSRGESSEGFHLIPVRSGLNAHRLYTERNLAEVLRYIDLDDPALSPLLTVPQGTHGGAASIFHGTTGNTQLRTVRAWIKTVVEQKKADEAEFDERPSVVAAKRTATPNMETQPSHASIHGTVDRNERATIPQKAVEILSAKEEVASVRENERTKSPMTDAAARTVTPATDAFDPDEFNRRFHAPPRRFK